MLTIAKHCKFILKKECSCNRLNCAKDILTKNNIDYNTFGVGLQTTFEQGRERHVNIILHGPADCGKTFLLKHFCKLLPNVFMNLVSSNFGWLGREIVSLTFLNGLRWAPKGINGEHTEWGGSLQTC